VTPSDLDQRLVESRELIKQGDYDRALELLKAAIAQARQQTERLREAYLLMIQTYVILGNYHRSQPHEHAASELDYQEAGARIRECLRTPGLRHTRLGSESEYPAEMVRAFADVRGEIFGSFRVTGLEPQGATVILDGDTLRTQADGKLGDTDLPVGPHNVLIQQPGYQTRNDAIVIAASSMLERSYVLSKPQGRGLSLTRGALGLAFVAGLGASIWSTPADGGLLDHYTSRSLDIDPSIRAAGMAGASGAVFWGDDLDDWGNPALLGLGKGLRYQWGTTQQVPGGLTNVRFTTHRIVLGFGGIGIGLPGMPGEQGSASLDFRQPGADENGNYLASDFRSTEDVRSWGAGISVLRAFESLAGLAGYSPPPLSRNFDAAFGIARKHVRALLSATAPFAGLAGAESSVDATDHGFLVHATLMDRSGSQRRGAPVRLEASYARATLDRDDSRLLFPNGYDPVPTARLHRSSFGLHLTAGAIAGAGRWRWLPAESLNPLISIGAALDFEHPDLSNANTHHYGIELTVANFLTLRAGSLQNGKIQATSMGIGVGYRYKDVVGFRYDWAAPPDWFGAYVVRRQEVLVFLDPMALARRLR